MAKREAVATTEEKEEHKREGWKVRQKRHRDNKRAALGKQEKRERTQEEVEKAAERRREMARQRKRAHDKGRNGCTQQKIYTGSFGGDASAVLGIYFFLYAKYRTRI